MPISFGISVSSDSLRITDTGRGLMRFFDF